MENDTMLNINPAFKHLLDKCNIQPNHLSSKSFDITDIKPIRKQQKINLHFASKSINWVAKNKITNNEFNLKFKPEVLASIKNTIKDTYENQQFYLGNSDENYNLTEPMMIENTQDENQKIEESEKKLKWKENALLEMRNTNSYKELINYKSGDLKKKKRFTQIPQGFSCPDLIQLQQNSMSFNRPFTSTTNDSYKISFTEHSSIETSNNPTKRIKSKKKAMTIKEIPKRNFRNATIPPIHKVFDSFGLVKLSEKLKFGKTSRSSSDIRARPITKNTNDTNQSYNHIIESCKKAHIINKSFVKDFKQEGTLIVNKFKSLHQENSSEKIKLKIWEKEEIVKYKKKLNEMTKSQMLAFKSINERRISKCSNSDKLLLHP